LAPFPPRRDFKLGPLPFAGAWIPFEKLKTGFDLRIVSELDGAVNVDGRSVVVIETILRKDDSTRLGLEMKTLVTDLGNLHAEERLHMTHKVTTRRTIFDISVLVINAISLLILLYRLENSLHCANT